MVQKIKKQKELTGVLLGASDINNLLMTEWNVNCKVNCIELELMMFLRFNCLVLMIKNTY